MLGFNSISSSPLGVSTIGPFYSVIEELDIPIEVRGQIRTLIEQVDMPIEIIVVKTEADSLKWVLNSRGKQWILNKSSTKWTFNPQTTTWTIK